MSIPTVAGRSQAKATRLLRSMGLKVLVQREHSNTVPSGQATRTDPLSGTSVQVGSAVTLFISSGKQMAQVPNVVGQSRVRRDGEAPQRRVQRHHLGPDLEHGHARQRDLPEPRRRHDPGGRYDRSRS